MKRQEIWQAIEVAVRADKRNNSSFPDHPAGMAVKVVSKSGTLMKLCMELIVQQCDSANIPVFVKQMGTHLAKELNMSDRHGGKIEEFPERLKIRQFPKY